MTKILKSVLLVMLAGLMAMPVIADAHDDEDATFTWNGQVRGRYDRFQFGDNQLLGDDVGAVDFWPYRAQLGVTGNFSDRVYGQIDLQAFGHFGDFWSGRDQIGGLVPVYGYTGPSLGQVSLYQGFLVIEGGKWDFNIGRRERVLGNSLMVGNNRFYNGLVFDGIEASADYGNVGVTLFYDLIAERLNTPAGTGGPLGLTTGDAPFVGAYVDFGFGDGKYKIAPYLFYNENHQIWGPGFGTTLANFFTFGLQFERPVSEDGGWDLNVELAGQSGNMLGDVADVEGTIFEGWFGWTFGDDTKHRINVGYFLASGQEATTNPTTSGKYEAWVPLFEDPHEKNRLGNLDLFAHEFDGQMTNIQDISVAYRYKSASKKHGALFAIHSLSLAEKNGAGEDAVGTEVDIEYMHYYTKTTSFQIGLAYLSAGKAATSIQSLSNLSPPTGETELDDIYRLYAGLNLRWGKGMNWQ